MRRPTGRFHCARPRTPARGPPKAQRDDRRRDTRRRASAALPRRGPSAPPRPAPTDKQPRRRSRQRCRPPRQIAWRKPARTRGPAADGFPLRRGRVAAGHAHHPCGTPPPAAPPRLRRAQCRPQPLRGAGRREASGGRRENGASEQSYSDEWAAHLERFPVTRLHIRSVGRNSRIPCASALRSMRRWRRPSRIWSAPAPCADRP